MKNLIKTLFCFALLFVASAKAQITVSVAPPKITAQKVVVQLDMTNELTSEVKSARAICLLLDEHGKMVGQSTKWVIGQNKASLDPKGQAIFNFVITTPRPLISSNLTAKVVFSRVILDGGKVVDPRKAVEIMPAIAGEKSKSK
jgi:hypothetical protein